MINRKPCLFLLIFMLIGHDPRTRNAMASLAIPTRFIGHDPRTRNGSASLAIATRFIDTTRERVMVWQASPFLRVSSGSTRGRGMARQASSFLRVSSSRPINLRSKETNRVTKESVSFISSFRKIFTIAWGIISISLPVLSTKQVS